MSKRRAHLTRALVTLVLALVFTVTATTSCTTQRDALNRGQRYYDENEYEKALALWRALEVDSESLSDHERARYAYLRGMTDYRLGYRSDARHWLAIAKAIEKKYPGGLEDDWKRRADEALEDLNKDVYGVEQFSATGATGQPGNSPNPASLQGEPSGATGSAGAGGKANSCRTDSDCSGDQVCVSKYCVQP